MRLTNYSDYALRSLIYLAVKPEPQTLANISDIVESYNISKSHLTKIIHQLGQLGYIEGVRGKNGGIRLARAPKDINLGVLIKQIEPDFALVECFATPSPSREHDNLKSAEQKGLSIALVNETDVVGQEVLGCVISPACQLKGVFFAALTAFINVLEGYTLADIINNKVELAELLS
ncbi:Rrf2 family transcriptional regulator [Psychrobacter frigidicola]|uniref:Rrf2 family transcriptional regulator n=1 Tax=Psychrobacter frigidicola TaxID=45611 RepID=A0A5C7A5W8_9GAMM|nr:Rrf2 family transcriptional regulator [Psychrobacter frigidicola]TXD98050.1 Rrf2 family transcriptional regulator [Psychrobacter frigidicola]